MRGGLDSEEGLSDSDLHFQPFFSVLRALFGRSLPNVSVMRREEAHCILWPGPFWRGMPARVDSSSSPKN